MRTIVVMKRYDWDMLKAEATWGAQRVMEIVEDAGREEEAMKLLGHMAGPLWHEEVDTFITCKLLKKLGIERSENHV